MVWLVWSGLVGLHRSVRLVAFVDWFVLVCVGVVGLVGLAWLV